jgi:hypothetical protein
MHARRSSSHHAPVRHAVRSAAALVAVAASVACGEVMKDDKAPPPTNTPARSLTIYSSMQPGAVDPAMYRPVQGRSWGDGSGVPGYAIIREDRAVTLGVGRSQLKITDVAALIDPTTVSFRSLTDPSGARVIDQNFQFDLVSTEKLMEKFLDKEISVEADRGTASTTIKGTLLSAQGGQLILKNKDGEVEVVNGYRGVSLPSLPGGLMTRPTLLWNMFSETGGNHTARVSYETKGITWWADYNLVFAPGADQNSGKLDISAWVSILNQSGATYADSQLKLIAGEVQRAQPKYNRYPAARANMAMEGVASAAPQFDEKSFFEYHMYTLSEPTTIPESSTKQLELFPTARSVPCEKILLYAGQGDWSYWGDDPAMEGNYGVPTKTEVDVYLKFKNDKPSGLGIPLPAGRIRVSQADTDGSLEFIGEDTLKHTPRDETLLLRLGKSFDVVGGRKQVDFNVDSNRKRMTETVEIELRNRKQEAVKVVAQERMFRWVNWEFVGAAPENLKLDARTIHFPVTLAPGETKTLRYTVRYSW